MSKEERLRQEQLLIEASNRLKRDEKQRLIEEERRWSRWTLADLSGDKKQKIQEIIRQFYKEYLYEKEVNEMLTGLKWLFILLGVALLLNFGHILKIIEMALNCR